MAENLTQHLRIVQLLTVALAMGPVMFGVALLFMPPIGGTPPLPGVPLLTMLGIGLGLMLQVVRALITFVVVQKEVHRIAPRAAGSSEADVMALLQLYRNMIIVRAAMFEGAAFFLLVAYMIERNPLALAGAAAMVLGVLAGFPTEARVAGWLEQQLKRLTELRSGGK